MTNYSVNKNSENFVANKDANDDLSGSKWSMAGLKDFFRINGINSDLIFERMEDVAIKTILSIENTMYSSCE